jgi:hypothetical protein
MSKRWVSTEEGRMIIRQGDYNWYDLHTWVQDLVSNDTEVQALNKSRWVLVGNTYVLLKELSADVEDSFARVVIRPKTQPFLDWFFLLITRFRDEGEWYRWGSTIPDTNIVIDVWYYGDGRTEGIVLAAETNKNA